MDPLSALSIAASVVQFIQFSASLVSKAHEIYTSTEGTLAENVRSEAATKRLIDLVDKLRAPSVAGPLPPADSRSLEDICSNCVSISNELVARLDKLRVYETHNHRKWKSFRQALKSVWSKDGLEAIRKKLAACKDELDMHLIVSIRNKIYDSSLQQSQAFASLDRKTQICIQSLLDNRKLLDQKLSDHKDTIIRAGRCEHTMTRNIITAASTSQNKLELTSEEIEPRVFDGLSQSLRFPTMIDRREGISQAHSETFKWILRTPPNNETSWSNFIQWLEYGSDIYWINGKAGSGKSTLMRYILENPITLKHLRSNGDQIEVLGFFFWNSGSAEQRSQNGLLRTLLFEILQRYPHLSSQLFPDEWARNFSAVAQGNALTWHWTSNKLQQAFRLLTNYSTATLKFCFFIDGLDEYEGDHGNIAQFFRDISSAPHVKICVSSRPLLVFEEAFHNFPGLRLQYLTFHDISSYVRNEFQEHPRMVQLAKSKPAHAVELVNEIVTKASGVFLWVKLVIKSLLNGLRNRDDISDLNKRLRDIPNDIEALYRHMLSCIEPLYKEQAFRTFEIYKVMSQDDGAFAGGVSPLDLSLAITANVKDSLALDMEELNETEVEERCEWIDVYLKTRCAGLLEIHFLRRPIGLASTKRNGINLYSTSKVQYLHRSVREFLESDEVRILLSSSSPRDTTLEANKAIFMSYITSLKKLECWHKDFYPEEEVDEDELGDCLEYGMKYARAADDHSAAHVALLDQFDRVFSRLCQLYTPTGTLFGFEFDLGRHWSATTSSDDKENCNFLSEAVKRGLCSYVDAKLKEDKSRVIRKRGLPLLDYAFQTYDEETPHSYIYDIIQVLLQNGADPNALWNGNTPWQRILTRIHRWSIMWGEDNGIYRRNIPGDMDDTLFWARVIKLLLENGASPYTTCTYNHFGLQGGREPCSWHNVLDVIKDAFQMNAPEEASELMQLLRQKRMEHDMLSGEGSGSKRRFETENLKSNKRQMLRIGY